VPLRPSRAFVGLAFAGGLGGLGLSLGVAEAAPAQGVDYNAVRTAIAGILDKDGYDDGSIGPVLIRLAWHASGTYDRTTGKGGSDGATMRFKPESAHGANAGLDLARAFLEPIKQQFPGITYADLWSLAGAVAIEEMNGPRVPWRAGRSDKADGSYCTPDGLLPDATQGAAHLRHIFYRMGFNDQEIVALSGAHTFGACHTYRSGFSGPWTRAPTTFSNLYFVELLQNKWTPKKWSGPLQYEDPSGELMMLPTDVALLSDPAFRKWVDIYAQDEDRFAADFVKAFVALEELGVRNLRSV